MPKKLLKILWELLKLVVVFLILDAIFGDKGAVIIMALGFVVNILVGWIIAPFICKGGNDSDRCQAKHPCETERSEARCGSCAAYRPKNPGKAGAAQSGPGYTGTQGPKGYKAFLVRRKGNAQKQNTEA